MYCFRPCKYTAKPNRKQAGKSCDESMIILAVNKIWTLLIAC